MSYSPFDGVLLDDVRPPIPGALLMSLHFQIAEIQGIPTDYETIVNRATACRELLEHGLSPVFLRKLSVHGLDLGYPKDTHSLNSLISHMELYLEAVSSLGFIEPNVALWNAVDAELQGKRGFWIERSPQDGHIEARLSDVKPARLRALACLPQLGGAIFRLATRRGGSDSGLFGSGQPLVEWFLEGMETHGHAFPADIQLGEPLGWGVAPWSSALDSLFEKPLHLEEYKACFQRSLVDSPWNLIRHSVEQIVAWVTQGISPESITVVHPAPERIRELLEALLKAEKIQLGSSKTLHSLIQSETWSPIWSFLDGLAHFDPWNFASGLLSSKQHEIGIWAEILSTSDQSGQRNFETSINFLPERYKPKVNSIWLYIKKIFQEELTPSEWAETINDLIESRLRFFVDSENFYSPMGLLKESWNFDFLPKGSSGKKWDFHRMLASLRVFLESTKSEDVAIKKTGVQLISPSELMERWNGSEATLVLDLSEGAWPTSPKPNPDLDWQCRASINSALLKASVGYEGIFPPALQRFWLPRSEHLDQIPRAFQRDAYAFNKVLAMTKQHLVALSPSQDDSGRKVSQGPFWVAIEGAGDWEPNKNTCYSDIRWAWDGFYRKEYIDNRSISAKVLGAEAMFSSKAPNDDHLTNIRPTLQNQQKYISPTMLESLASCPFRTIAERVWKLGADDASSQIPTTVGTIAHKILQSILLPFLNIPNWPNTFVQHFQLPNFRSENLENLVMEHWNQYQNILKKLEAKVSSNQLKIIRQQIESLLPNIASYIQHELEDNCLTPYEMEFLNNTQKEGWQKTIIGLEYKLGPVDLLLQNGKNIAVAGVVDRIELWENPATDLSFHRIVDYKTTTKNRLSSFVYGENPFSSHLQLPLYMWIAMESFNTQVTSVLIPLRDITPMPYSNLMNYLNKYCSGSNKWQTRLGKTLECLDAQIDSGDFPPTPGEQCRYCKFSALCMRPVDTSFEDEGETEK
ncbi:MAG: PD-(D/E)XK nuclease family protein [Holophagaceae bacterium]|nr:PD-(D/E)XK nuclease family protein [Holophagaceae bacterium]